MLAGSSVRFAPVELAESATMRLARLYPRSTIKPATRTVLIPRPMTASLGGEPLINVDLLEWVGGVLKVVASPMSPSV